MIEVFNQGAFSSYRIEDSRYNGVLTESRSFSAGTRRATKRTVFLSPKHSDLEDLKGFIGYLERYYCVECYIDADDPGMPEKTSGGDGPAYQEDDLEYRQVYTASNG